VEPSAADAAERAALEEAANARPPEPERVGSRLAFRTRLTFALIAAAVLPLATFGLLLVLAQQLPDPGSTIPRLLLLATVLAALLAVLVAYLLAAGLTAPLRAIAAAVDRVKAGDLSTPITVGGDDELAHLAESHNRLAAALERRNRELGRILAGIAHGSPHAGPEMLIESATIDAREAFGLIDAYVLRIDPWLVPDEELVPGEPLPVRAELRAGGERLGLLVGHLPATRTWERADQDLLEVFAAEVGASLRNAELLARVETQNARLVELDAAKDEFLRGVSHNLQTPLTSIRAHAEQLAADGPDRRLGIIAEQVDRMSRMVRQLLTVSRLETGMLHPKSEVLALAPRVRRAWEALGAGHVQFTVDDRAAGWLAVGDGDQLDQVLWALLDNAVKYGDGGPVDVAVVPDDADGRVRLTIVDHGPGVSEADRPQLFGRFGRGSREGADDGTGLGLYVSRELVRAMGGELVLEPEAPGRGAAFSVLLPGEPVTAE
jgi:signal transduction histidine kinase